CCSAASWVRDPRSYADRRRDRPMWSSPVPLAGIEARTAAEFFEAVFAERGARREYPRRFRCRFCGTVQAERLRARKIRDQNLEFAFGDRCSVATHRLPGRLPKGFDVLGHGIVNRPMVEQLATAIADLEPVATLVFLQGCRWCWRAHCYALNADNLKLRAVISEGDAQRVSVGVGVSGTHYAVSSCQDAVCARRFIGFNRLSAS